MPIPVICPTCKSKFLSPSHLAGKNVGCPKCRNIIPISSQEEHPIPSDEEDSLDPSASEIPVQKKSISIAFVLAASLSCFLILGVGTLLVLSWNVQPEKRSYSPQEIEGSAWQPIYFDDIKLTISKVIIDKVKIKNLFQDSKFTNDHFFIIFLTISNTSSSKKYHYKSPLRNKDVFFNYYANLKDDKGNQYNPMNLELGVMGSESDAIDKSLYPNSSIEEVLVFEKPIENLDFLVLQLNCEFFEQQGKLQIKIAREFFDENFKKYLNLIQEAERAFKNKEYQKSNHLFEEAILIHNLDANQAATWMEAKAAIKNAEETNQIRLLKEEREREELEIKKKELEAKRIQEEELKKAAIPLSTRIREYGQLVKGDDEITGIKAAKELAQLGIQAVEAVPDLANALQNKSSKIRKEANIALGKIGPSAIKAIPDLVYCSIYYDNSSDKADAVQTINQICPTVEDKAHSFIKMLSDPKKKYRLAALLNLKNLGEKASSFANQISPYLKDLDPEIRKQSLSTLMAIKPDGLPILNGYLVDEDESIRTAVRGYIGSHESKEKYIEILATHLENSNDEIRKEIAVTLGNELSPSNTISLTESTKLKFFKALSDPEPTVRLEIARILISYSLEPIKTEKILIELCKAPQSEIVSKALQVLKNKTAISFETFSELVGLIPNWDTQNAKNAANLLLKNKIKSSDLIPKLIKGLKNKAVLREISELLAFQGVTAIPTLVQELENPSQEIKLGCVISLGLIGKPAYEMAYKSVSNLYRSENDQEIKMEASRTLGYLRGK